MTARGGAGLRVLLAATLLGVTGCRDDAPEGLAIGAPEQLASPAGEGSSEPNLTVGPDGRVYMSWQQAVEGGHELRFAALGTDAWSEPRVIARGADWFVNWADFPSLLVLPDGQLAAHYLRRNPTGETYHYDVEIVRSSDGGESWSAPLRPHRDGVPAEHGFASLFPVGDAVGAIWLDGRKYHERYGGSEEMSLRFTTLTADGALGPEVALDERVCDCCQTDVAQTSAGPVAVYRGRTTEEVRDIRIARLLDGSWTSAPVHADGWTIAGCPVNGPAVDARGSRVVVAWFTGANDTSRVRVAFSDDAGASFGTPLEIDSGDPLGRVGVVLLEDGGALVSWLGREGDAAAILVRRVAGGVLGPTVRVATSSQARASGFPQIARAGDDLVFAWTEPGERSRVLVSRARLGRGG